MLYETVTKNTFTVAELAARIDHTLLLPYASEKEVAGFAEEALKYPFKVLCVNNCNVGLVSRLLKGTGVKTAGVVAFPFGALSPGCKASETKLVIEEGADIVDFVENIGAVKSHDWAKLEEEFSLMEEAAHNAGKEIKVILECCYLTDEEKLAACLAAKKAGLDYVKTSTGFGTGAATLGDVRLMKAAVGENMGVKASGPIADYYTAVAMLNAGASRIGSRRGIDILRGCPDWSDKYGK